MATKRLKREAAMALPPDSVLQMDPLTVKSEQAAPPQLVKKAKFDSMQATARMRNSSSSLPSVYVFIVRTTNTIPL